MTTASGAAGPRPSIRPIEPGDDAVVDLERLAAPVGATGHFSCDRCYALRLAD